jgi:anti-sigma28 factor (negative regulator of flagellin synthesis)
MTTKKIESGEVINTGLLKGLANHLKVKGKAAEHNPHLTGDDSKEGRINLTASKAIASELNPELFATERREKIEKLKEQIQSGNYKPKSEDVAAALQQDIVFEILSNPTDAANE